MAKRDYILAKQQTLQFLEKTGATHHMFHGPTSDEYWSSPLRVLAVNMESYGYEGCGFTEVDLPCLLGWMYDKGHTGTKTVRYTFSIIRTLISANADGILPTGHNLRKAYSNAAELEVVGKCAVYYNIRPTSNPNKEQDHANIIASGNGTLSQLIRDEMMALEPHVILVSGHAGLAAFNAMWQLDPKLGFLGSCWHSDKILIQSIRHPSRPNYGEFASAIAGIVRELKAGA